jgi:hypothetical protein
MIWMLHSNPEPQRAAFPKLSLLSPLVTALGAE